MKQSPTLSLGHLLLISALLCLGCSPTSSRNLVQTSPSPDGSIEAVVFETNDGATTSFGYEIDIRKIGDQNGVNVAVIYGAIRNKGAYGVNLKWSRPETLHIEYLSAKSVVNSKSTSTVDGKQILISLDSGTNDRSAPAGGMLYNLRKK